MTVCRGTAILKASIVPMSVATSAGTEFRRHRKGNVCYLAGGFIDSQVADEVIFHQPFVAALQKHIADC